MSKRVVIIGAGVIGLCTAYYAAQRGWGVTVVDQGEVEAQGCSFGNAGMVVPSHFAPLAAPGMVGMAVRMMFNSRSPFFIKPRLDLGMIGWGLKFRKAANAGHVARCSPVLRDWNMASRALYEALAEIPGNDFGLVCEGLLMLCKTEKGLEEEGHAAEKANALGVPARVLDRAAAAAMEPEMEMEIAGAVHFPMDCHLSPGRLMKMLTGRLVEMGASFRWKTEVTGWRKSGEKIEAAMTHSGEAIEGDEFVLCGGSWSPAVARELGVKLPMQPGKGYSLTLDAPRQLPRLCSILTEARVAVTPMGRSLRFGGTMEMSGMNHIIRPNRVEGIVSSIPAYYPKFSEGDFTDVKPWCGLRPCSPDGMPYIGRTRACTNLSIATGHAMMGISLGPITGQVMAQILEGEKPGMKMGLMDPDRYAGRRLRSREA